MQPSIYTPEFFSTDLAESYASAQRIVPLVLSLGRIASVLDVGCGTGHFLRAIAESGISDLLGIDGDYVPREQLEFDPAHFRPVDLSKPFDAGRRFDLAISLEVAEHLPAESASDFVASIVNHATLILFSAAVPYQGGTGHVNEQWPSYWAALFAKHGYRAYDIVRPALWAEPDVAWWYRQNCLLFAGDRAMQLVPSLSSIEPSRPEQLDRVHPALYEARCRGWQEATNQFTNLRSYLRSGSLFAVEQLPDGRLNIARK